MRTMLTAVTLLLLTALPLAAANPKEPAPVPDLTQGGSIGYDMRWTLGSTGARGWIHSDKRPTFTARARQIYVTDVAKGSPADGLLAEGDVILGLQGKRGEALKPFSTDPRHELADAITEAEKNENGGELRLLRWRAGKQTEVTLKLAVLGSFSATAPYDCAKTAGLVDLMVKAILEDGIDNGENPVDGGGIPGLFKVLGLMATGREDVMPVVKARVEELIKEPVDGMKWGHAWTLVTLEEYYLRTGDKSVLPAIRRYALETARGQSIAGTWGHQFAGSDGIIIGYGSMNQVSLVHTIGLILAQKCGVEDSIVKKAADKSVQFFSYYIGKGSVPYGAHEAGDKHGPDDNGKSSGAAIIFNLMEDKEGATFFSRHGVYDHSRIEVGHASNFFHLPWQGLASAQLGPKAAAAHFNECRWYYELLRDWRGKTQHHEAPGFPVPAKPWDATGARLLFFSLPQKALYLTGKGGYVPDALGDEALAVLLESSRHDHEYNTLDNDELVRRLGDWCHATRYRAAQELATREGDWCSKALEMFAKGTQDQKYGALRLLEALKEKAAPAVDQLVLNLKDPDLWTRIRSVYALADIGKPAYKAAPAMLDAVHFDDPTDQRKMFRRILTKALFHQKIGFLRTREAMDAVDHDKLIAAIKLLLRGEEGESVTALATPLKLMSFEELQPLWPEIVYRVEHRLSENVMFANMQTPCLELLAKFHVDEGLRLVGYKMALQNHWNSGGKNKATLQALRNYGVHGKRAFYPLQQYLRSNSAFNAELQAFKKDILESKEKPELVSIEPWLDGHEIGAYFESLVTLQEFRKMIASGNLAEYWKVYEQCQKLTETKPAWAKMLQALVDDELLIIPEAKDIVEAHHAIDKITQDVRDEKITREEAIQKLIAYRDKYDIEKVGPNLVYWYSQMRSDALKKGKMP